MLNSLINQSFKNAKKENRPVLLTYTVAGDNTKKKSLEILRDEISDWRSRFKSLISINSDRISLVQTQLNSLPTSPDDGTEDPLKERRNELKTLLNDTENSRFKSER